MHPVLLSVAVAILAVPAHAQTHADFAVSARVVNGCAVSIDGGGALGRIDFGSLPGTASQSVEADLLSSSGAGIAIECTPGATANLSADMGDHAAGGERRLGHGTNRIAYRLLVGSGATVWGSQSVALSFPVGGGTQRLAVKGRAILTGAHAAGHYTDTVRVTVTW